VVAALNSRRGRALLRQAFMLLLKAAKDESDGAWAP